MGKKEHAAKKLTERLREMERVAGLNMPLGEAVQIILMNQIHIMSALASLLESDE